VLHDENFFFFYGYGYNEAKPNRFVPVAILNVILKHVLISVWIPYLDSNKIRSRPINPLGIRFTPLIDPYV
jgi:hypothetical protein